MDVKTGLVLKATDVISKGRLEFDAGWTDFAASFMSIRKTTTAAGGRVTYQAGRSEETSHADLAWACMHALAHEPIEGVTTTNTSIMEFS
ncbi:Terminase-like family protein [compost metagenome]